MKKDKKSTKSIKKKWLPISDAARFLGVSQDTLRRWEKKDKLVPRRTVGGHRRYSRKQLERILKQPMDQPTKTYTSITKDILTKQTTSHQPQETRPKTTHIITTHEEKKFLGISLKTIKTNAVTFAILIIIIVLLLVSFLLLKNINTGSEQEIITPVPAYKEIS